MNHFAARFNIQPFIIYDENHHVAGVYDGEDWSLVADDVPKWKNARVPLWRWLQERNATSGRNCACVVFVAVGFVA